MNESPALPLSRFTVIEVNDAGVPLPLRLAASLAGKIAADLGATVLKIEPPGGDPLRAAPPLLPGGESALFHFLNTSKKSLVLDLGGERGRATLAGLLDKADACLFEEPSQTAELLRASRATPIEIAPFPVGMDPAIPYSEFTLMALGGLLGFVNMAFMGAGADVWGAGTLRNGVVAVLLIDGMRYYVYRDGTRLAEPDPSRAVNVQDCTTPVDTTRGNLVCR